MNTSMRVLAHEWLVSAAGSDKVAARIVHALGIDEVITAFSDPAIARALLGDVRVRNLWTNHLPGVADARMAYAPAILAAWAGCKVGNAELLISNAHFGATGAGRRFDGPHVAMCHSPMRYAWRTDLESDRLTGVAGRVGRAIVPTLQRFDRRSADSVSLFLGNSSSIVRRIEDAYGRPAAVVHPVVDVDHFTDLSDGLVHARSGGHYLCFGRLVAYKRVDLAVRACTARSLPLVVAGAGPELAGLREIAGPTVTFEEQVCDARYRELLGGSRALLFPGEEDFGIVPVEAMAAGVPVIAFGRGGALDTIVDGVTGVLFPEQTVDSLVGAIELLEATTFDVAKLRTQADCFRPEVFDERLRSVVNGHLAGGARDRY